MLTSCFSQPKKSGLLPFHLIGEMIEYVKDCQYVDDEGTILYYKNKDGKVTSSEEGAKIRYPESERA